MNTRYPFVARSDTDGVTGGLFVLVGFTFFNTWLSVPLLVVLIAALVALSDEPRPRSVPLFLLQLFCVVLVSYPLGSAFPLGYDAIVAGDQLSLDDVIVLLKFISPIGISVGLICGSCFFFVLKIRQRIALLLSQFVVIAYAGVAMLRFMLGSASV